MLKDGIFIVGVELCALQAATYLPFRELVEYYFELCSAYSLGTGSSTSYNERFALTSTERLKQFFNSITRCDGLALARKAIQCVRDRMPVSYGNSLCHDANAAQKRRRAWY